MPIIQPPDPPQAPPPAPQHPAVHAPAPQRKPARKKKTGGKAPDVPPRGMTNVGSMCWLNALLQSLIYSNAFTDLIEFHYIQDSGGCSRDHIFQGIYQAISDAKVEPPKRPVPGYPHLGKAMHRVGLVDDLDNADVVKLFHLLLLHLDSIIEKGLGHAERPFAHLFRFYSQRLTNCECGARTFRKSEDTVLTLNLDDDILRGYLAEGRKAVSTDFLIDRAGFTSTPIHYCGDTPTATIRHRIGRCLTVHYSQDEPDSTKGPLPDQTLSLKLLLGRARWNLFAAILHHEHNSTKKLTHYTTLVFTGGKLYEVNDRTVQNIPTDTNLDTLILRPGWKPPTVLLAFYEVDPMCIDAKDANSEP